VLTEVGMGPGDGQSGRLSVSSRRNDGGGEQATGAQGSG
jgi:hypothetical protein